MRLRVLGPHSVRGVSAGRHFRYPSRRSERRDWPSSSCLARGPNIAYSSMIFQLKIWIPGYRFPVAVFWDFLALGAKVLWRARPWQSADGDGVQHNDVIYTYVLNRGGQGVRSPIDSL